MCGPRPPPQENFLATTRKYVEDRAQYSFLRLLTTNHTDIPALKERFATAGKDPPSGGRAVSRSLTD